MNVGLLRASLWCTVFAACAIVAGLVMFPGSARAQETAPTAEAQETVDPGRVSAGGVDEALGEKNHDAHADAHDDHGGAHAVPDVHWAWIIPFALLLGSIALMPLINHHFWEHNYPWFAFALGSVTAVYYLFFFDDPGAPGAWLHEMQEYVSFIALLGSLYIVSGGIVIHVTRRATPMTNTTLLLIGAVIANVVGTTGAAMLLIRPYIRINRAHIKPYHIVFFIFIVANCGGALTPIGDPPLFMGYLKGVPFFWVLEDCWPMWAVCVALLLVVFFVIDTRDHQRAKRAEHEHDAGRAVEIFGFQNFIFIHVILIAVFRPSMFTEIREGDYLWLPVSREVLMLLAAVASKLLTKPYIYERNEFTYAPIREVAILFVGIFSTMVPALNYLNHHADQMPLKTPGQYYFLTGSLSAVLDNAPTYLVFLETRQGQVVNERGESIAQVSEALRSHAPGSLPRLEADADDAARRTLQTLVRYKEGAVRAGKAGESDVRIAATLSEPALAAYLIAISIGAVFFGACTYIGNGPNFMVKSIAESAGIAMPGFFGYFIRFALPILVPILILIWLIFFQLKLWPM